MKTIILQAIKMSAIDYLLKPISKEDLLKAINTFKKRIVNSESNFGHLKNQLDAIKNNNLLKISLPTPDGFVFVELDHILYFTADDMYCYAHLSSNQKLFLNRTLKYLEETLDGLQFFRVHKSYLVNTTKVKKFLKSDRGFLIMEDEKEIPIARMKKDEFINFMNLA
ncbi:MAG: hypothetical protein RLZZ546_2191 [Bacteroidota bacterium]|jgi:two-component system LytT family response regulator